MCQRRGQWILDCSMGLLMDILGLVNGVTNSAVEALEWQSTITIKLLKGSLELDQIIQDFSNTDQCRDIKQIIRHCRNMSETQLVTIKDLLRFMLTVKFNFVL